MGSDNVTDVEAADESVEPEPTPEPAPSRWERVAAIVRWPVERWLLLVGVPVGLFFVFFIPPTQGIDESAHFTRAWLVSGGDVVAASRIDRATGMRHAGGVLDRCVIDYLSKFQIRAAEPDAFEVGDFWLDTPPCSPQRRAWFIADAASNYAPAAYAPQSLVLAVTRAVGLPVPVSFFAGRLAGLAAFLALAWLGIRHAPGGKAVLLVVALLPTSLMSAATYNADAVAIGLALLAVGLTAGLALDPDEPIGRRWRVVALAAAIAGLGIAKQPYLVLALLPFLIPNRVFGGVRNGVLAKLGIAAFAAVVSLGWLVVGSPDVSPTVFRAGIDHGAQLKHMIRQPFDFLATVARTIAAAGPQSYTLRGMVGSFGMGRYVGRANDVVAPMISVVFAAALLTSAGTRDLGVARAGLGRAQRAIAAVGPLAITLVGILAVYASMYMIWAPVGDDYVYDVQGRYFIPLVAVPSLTLVLRRHGVVPERTAAWITAGSVALLAFAVAKSFLVFY